MRREKCLLGSVATCWPHREYPLGQLSYLALPADAVAQVEAIDRPVSVAVQPNPNVLRIQPASGVNIRMHRYGLAGY